MAIRAPKLLTDKQAVWLTPAMVDAIEASTGLPLDDGLNACPDVAPLPCRAQSTGHWEEVEGVPEVLLMHSVLLPDTDRVLFWGRTREVYYQY